MDVAGYCFSCVTETWFVLVGLGLVCFPVKDKTEKLFILYFFRLTPVLSMLMNVLARAAVGTCRSATGEQWQRMNTSFASRSTSLYSLILNITSIFWRNESMAVPHDQ